MKTSRIIVYVSGGVIQSIIGDTNVQVRVIDYDVDKQDSHDIDGLDIARNIYDEAVFPVDGCGDAERADYQKMVDDGKV